MALFDPDDLERKERVSKCHVPVLIIVAARFRLQTKDRYARSMPTVSFPILRQPQSDDGEMVWVRYEVGAERRRTRP